ncbi:MAG: 6-phosphogluconolactonase [Balneolaceae bacterium]
MFPDKKITVGKLKVEVFPDRDNLGKSSAIYVANQIKAVAKEKGTVRIIFASAVSQKEFLAELLKIDDIPWGKITAFHMDEYHTLPETAPQRFGNFLKEHLFNHRDFGAVHLMNNDLEEYSQLIEEAPIDIICLGIGENGHLAFNDPPVADFKDPKTVKVVELDEVCRQQQVNDGEFETLEEVPKTAITLTIPVLLKIKFLSIVVPGESKSEAIARTLFHPVSTECPSTVLRLHPNAKLFLDIPSAKNIMEKL